MKKIVWLLVVLLAMGALVVSGCSCGGNEDRDTETIGQDGNDGDHGDAADNDRDAVSGDIDLTGSANFEVTDCREVGREFEVTVNNRMIIRHIELKGDEVILPFYESHGGRKYDYVKAYGPDGETLIDDITTAVLAVADGAEFPVNEDNFDEFDIGSIETRVVERQDAPTLCFVGFVLNDELELGSFSVKRRSRAGDLLDGGSDYWIGNPGKKPAGGRWENSVEFSDEDEWNAMQKKIFASFLNEAGLSADDAQMGGPASSSSGAAGTNPVNDVYIAKIVEDDGTYTATLWGGIEVMDIKIDDGEVVLPYSENQSGKRYPFLKPPFRGKADALEQLQAAVEAFAEDGSFDRGEEADVEISDVFISGLNDRGAWGNVTFNNSMQICSFKISERNGSIRIFKPSIRTEGGDYVVVVEMPDSLWEDVQAKIEDAYRAKKRTAN